MARTSLFQLCTLVCVRGFCHVTVLNDGHQTNNFCCTFSKKEEVKKKIIQVDRFLEFLLPPLINLIQNSAKVRKGLKISKRKILIFAYLAKINLIRLSGHGHQWPCLSPVYHTEHIQVRLIEIDFQINNTKFSFPQPVRASCRSSVNTCPASRKRFAGTLASSWTR